MLWDNDLGLLDKGNKNFKVIQFSLITGFFIGLYSLVDGYGARASLSPIVYMSWAFILHAALFPIAVSYTHLTLPTKA